MRQQISQRPAPVGPTSPVSTGFAGGSSVWKQTGAGAGLSRRSST